MKTAQKMMNFGGICIIIGILIYFATIAATLESFGCGSNDNICQSRLGILWFPVKFLVGLQGAQLYVSIGFSAIGIVLLILGISDYLKTKKLNLPAK